VGCELFQAIFDVARSRQEWKEKWGLHNALALFNPASIT
jgi:galactarate dehydratase